MSKVLPYRCNKSVVLVIMDVMKFLYLFREIFQTLDMRAQGRLVKFPQSNLRFSHRLSTCKELLYISDGDCNGVFYHIGTSFGVHPWMNPVLTKVN